MSTDNLLILFSSDWFVAHAGAMGLLPALDQDDIESVSVAARTPIQVLMAQVESYYDVSFDPARIEATAEDFLARCRLDVRRYDDVAALVARYRALDEADFHAMSAWWTTLRVDDNERFLPPAVRPRRAALDALVDAERAGFTSWDESLDVFRSIDPDDSVLVDQIAAHFVPWCLMECVVASGGLAADAWAAMEDSAARLGIPEPVARSFARVAGKLAAL